MADPPKPSGTVVVVRERDDDLELLLLQRAPREGRPGPWVFPGGKVEASDRSAQDESDHARRAAVREAGEEAGLSLREPELVPISRWITPEISPRRFDTWFFLTRVARDAAVRVDGREIGDHRWLRPADALDAHHVQQIRLAPPTFVTVTWLADFRDAGAALRTLGARRLPPFRPRITRLDAGACMLYPGDAGYEAVDPEAPGPRHRLWALERWRYELDLP